MRILKLSKSFKILLIERAVGFLPPPHTPPAALSRTSSARFFDSLIISSIPAIPKSGKDFLEDRDKAVQCQCVRVRPDVKDLMQENDHILHTGQEALAQILAPVK